MRPIIAVARWAMGRVSEFAPVNWRRQSLRPTDLFYCDRQERVESGQSHPRKPIPTKPSAKTPTFQRLSVISSYQFRGNFSRHQHSASLTTHPPSTGIELPVFTLPKAKSPSQARAMEGLTVQVRTIRTGSPVRARHALRSRSTHASPSPPPARPSSRRSVRPPRARRWAGRTTVPASGHRRQAR